MAGRQSGQATEWAAAGPQTPKRKDYVLGLRQDRPRQQHGTHSAGRPLSVGRPLGMGNPPQLKRCRPKWRQEEGEAVANRGRRRGRAMCERADLPLL